MVEKNWDAPHTLGLVEADPLQIIKTSWWSLLLGGGASQEITLKKLIEFFS